MNEITYYCSDCQYHRQCPDNGKYNATTCYNYTQDFGEAEDLDFDIKYKAKKGSHMSKKITDSKWFWLTVGVIATIGAIIIAVIYFGSKF